MTTSQTFKNTVVILLTLLTAYVMLISLRILVVFLMAIIIASALRPMVDAMTRRYIPQGIAILLVYFTFLSIVGVVLVAALPPVINQVTGYFENEGRLAYRIIVAQRWVENLISGVVNDDVTLVDPAEIRVAVSDFMVQVRGSLPSFVDNIGTIIGEMVLVFVVGAYWLTSHEKATSFIQQLTPARYRENVRQVVEEIEGTLGAYVRGVFFVSLLSGTLNFVILQLLGVPNALTIGLVAAITTTIPMIGGLVGFIMAVFITLISNPEHLLTVVIVSFGVQQMESYFFAPRIMSSSVGLDPLLIILYTAIGFILFGVVGALIAVPIMGTIHILLTYFIIEPHQSSIKLFNTEGGLPLVQYDPVELEERASQLRK